MAAWALFIYGVLVGWVGCVQRKLLYHPMPDPDGRLEARAREVGFGAWTNRMGERIGWMRATDRPPAVATVLITHGNAGSAAGRDYLTDPLQGGVAVDVFVLEYPGFGGRRGEPGEAGLVGAMDEAMGLLGDRERLVLVGESLGCAVAGHGAGRWREKVAGVILLTPFNNLTAAARHHYPWLPVGWILRDRYPTDEWLGGYGGPVGVVVGGGDRVVPPGLGRLLHDGYAGRKRIWEIPGQDHWEAVQRPEEWWREAIGWVLDRPIP
jgi:pimeloyl-ACP methyl ester carboxylesterase